MTTSERFGPFRSVSDHSPDVPDAGEPLAIFFALLELFGPFLGNVRHQKLEIRNEESTVGLSRPAVPPDSVDFCCFLLKTTLAGIFCTFLHCDDPQLQSSAAVPLLPASQLLYSRFPRI